MANMKSGSPKKHEKTLLEKIEEKAAVLKDDLIAGKDHLVEAAEHGFESVKEKIHDLTAKKPALKKKVKKIAKKTAAKKLLSKKPAAKKKTVLKKAAKPEKKGRKK